MDSTFVLSKLVVFLIDPLNLLALLALLGVLALLIPSRATQSFGRVLLGAQAVLLIAAAALPLGQWALHPLEQRFPPPEELPAELAGIVVLGGALDSEMSRGRGTLEVTAAAERVMAMAALARAKPDLPIVFTGPTGPLLRSDGEAGDAVTRRLLTLGLAPDRIRIAPKSRNTWQDAVFAREALGGRVEGRWLLVTSAWHMPRAVGVFRQAGWEVVAYPVDYRSRKDVQFIQVPEGTNGLFDTMVAMKEWVGLASYHWLERTPTLFPAPEGG